MPLYAVLDRAVRSFTYVGTQNHRAFDRRLGLRASAPGVRSGCSARGAAATAARQGRVCRVRLRGDERELVTQTIGLGGELIFRPALETKLKVAYIRNKSDRADRRVVPVRVSRPASAAPAAVGIRPIWLPTGSVRPASWIGTQSKGASRNVDRSGAAQLMSWQPLVATTASPWRRHLDRDTRRRRRLYPESLGAPPS